MTLSSALQERRRICGLSRAASDARDIHMARYSIRKQGGEYVVLADDQSILRFTSRRKAAKLVADAAELLSVQSASPPEQELDSDQSAVKGAKFLDGEERFP
jgi:hypothetical protein